MIYNQETGSCKLCNAETLWGDAPHEPDCSFLIFSQIVDDCHLAISIDVGSGRRRKAVIRIFEYLCSSEDVEEIEYLSHEDYMGALETTAAEYQGD